MADKKRESFHQIFLISCWGEREGPDAPVTWRYQLEQPRRNIRQVCSSLDQLVAYLQELQKDV